MEKSGEHTTESNRAQSNFPWSTRPAHMSESAVNPPHYPIFWNFPQLFHTFFPKSCHDYSMDSLSWARPRKFTELEKLNEMLDRYQAGESTSGLAQAYTCDRSSIMYQLRKNGVYIPNRPTQKRPRAIRETSAEVDRRHTPKQRGWSQMLKRYHCCGSEIRDTHINTCVYYHVPLIDQTKIIDADTLNMGKDYTCYLRKEAEKKIKRFRCFAKASPFGVLASRPVALVPEF